MFRYSAGFKQQHFPGFDAVGSADFDVEATNATSHSLPAIIWVSVRSPEYQRLTPAMLTWQRLYRMLPSKVPAVAVSPSWEPAKLLLQSAATLDAYAGQLLQSALEASNLKLAPLRDPLGLNLGAHRWLATDREESYSDWLAWIIQGTSATADVVPLLGLHDPVLIESLGTPVSVTREEVTDQGRTDLVVRFDGPGLLLIEVKTQTPDRSLPLQLGRYTEWADRQGVAKDRILLVLLAPEEPDMELGRFLYSSWADLCRRLRRYACVLKGSDLMRAATILVFCGAVEQNILTFSAQRTNVSGFGGRTAQRGKFRTMASVDYMTTWGGKE